MSLITQQIPALFNGVSQQPATLRLPSQGEAQVNGYSTVADGLRKRPPMQHVAKPSGSNWSTAFIHTINRDVTERYIVVITDGDLQVFDTAGTPKTVAFPEGKTYLNVVGGGTADQSFACVSVADYTFIVNKTKVVAMATAGTDVSLPTGWANYYIPGTWAPIVTAAPDTYYYNSTGTYKGVKQTFSDLPKPTDSPAPVEGDIWKIAGYDQDSFGAYYVRRTGGVWEECVKPGLQNKFDDATMPWALVRESDGTFSFKPFKWNVRKIGDDESNPPPTFLGRTIRDVFFYKNRLAFVSDENVVFSGAGDYGNFWRSTVTDLIDSDVVDVAVSNTKVSILHYAVPFNNNLMLFADQTQFSLNVDQLLTPSSVSIDTVTEFEMNTNVRPVGIGNDIYFVTESGNYSRIREYFVQEGDANSTDAADVTAHVPKYVPKTIFKLAGNSNEDVLFAISKAAGERNRIYVYKFFWNEDGKAQSAWSYWEHGDSNTQIINIEVLENELYVLSYRSGDGCYLEKCNVQSGQTTGALDFEVLLDRLTEVTGTYYAGPDYTEWTLPYPVYSGQRANFRIVKGGDFTGAKGALIDPTTYTWFDNVTVRATGNHTAGEVHVGWKYTMSYTFSEQFLRNSDVAITTGRLQLRTFTVYYTDTAYFKTQVDPYGTGSLVQTEEIVPSALSEFTGKTLGSASLVTGEPVFHTGQYAFQIYGNSRDADVTLVNDTHVQASFQSAEWEGLYFNRARA